VNTLKKQLDKEVDTCRIKQTIIESQLDTIQKLKDVIILMNIRNLFSLVYFRVYLNVMIR